MALISCAACNEQISPKAPACPKCGEPNKKAEHLSGGSVFFGLLVAGLGIWWMAGGGFEGAAKSEMAKIEANVAADQVKQFEIAKRGGDKMQICVQAGMVTAAYLQANDEANYNEWKSVEKSACNAAGVPQ